MGDKFYLNVKPSMWQGKDLKAFQLFPLHIICTAHFNLSYLDVMQFTKYPKPGLASYGAII